MKTFVPTIDIHGPAAEHDMPCAVCRQAPAVLDLSIGVFRPCWKCQESWNMAHRPVLMPRWLWRWLCREAG